MSKLFSLFAAFALTAAAQLPDRPQHIIPPQLVQFLELTPEQTRAIAQANIELQRFAFDKSRRANQVERELREEMKRDPLDPMAIGLRHVELEGIRRQIEEEKKKTTASNQEKLNSQQKQKLTALQEILRMQSVACAAVELNLMVPPARPGPGNIIPAVRIAPVPVGMPAFAGGADACSGAGGLAGVISIFAPAVPR